MAKTWLADDDAGVYGGVYAFVDRAALTAYLDSDIVAQAIATPGITGLPDRCLASPADRVSRSRATRAGTFHRRPAVPDRQPGGP